MKAAKTITSTTLFERKLRQTMVGRERVFLFDQDWSAEHGAGYHSTVCRLAQLADLPLYEFEGFSLSEEKLVTAIVSQSATLSSELSNLRLLIESMEKQVRGVIVIHNAHKNNNNVLHLVARLASYVKRRKLHWKIILFADAAALDGLALTQLAIDRAYPASVLQADWTPENSKHTSSSHQGSRVKKGSAKRGTGFFERLSERFFS